MDSVLTKRWLEDEDAIPLIDNASVALVCQRVRAEGQKLGLSETVTGILVSVASELGHNQLAHASDGRIAVRPLRRAGVSGLEVIAADRGRGLLAPSQALLGVPPVPDMSGASGKKQSLGIGLAAVLELSDEVDFDVRIGTGTCIWARKFAEPVPRRRQVGIYGRPFPGEWVNGDNASFIRTEDALLLAVVDGLGHGPEALRASTLAIDTARTQARHPLQDILERCHTSLQSTRGAAMAIARVLETTDGLETASVGNVSTHLYGPQTSRRFGGSSFVLGAPGRARRLACERHPFCLRDVLVLFSDGLTTRLDLTDELDLLREHPIIIAHKLVERFGRDNDDLMVLVAG